MAVKGEKILLEKFRYLKKRVGYTNVFLMAGVELTIRRIQILV